MILSCDPAAAASSIIEQVAAPRPFRWTVVTGMVEYSSDGRPPLLRELGMVIHLDSGTIDILYTQTWCEVQVRTTIAEYTVRVHRAELIHELRKAMYFLWKRTC